jgi:hypothetical protein
MMLVSNRPSVYRFVRGLIAAGLVGSGLLAANGCATEVDEAPAAESQAALESASAFGSGPSNGGNCDSNEFWMHGQCWEIQHHCSGYDHTSKDVCNNGFDQLRCDWNRSSGTCYPEGSRPSDPTSCGPRSFWMNGRCYPYASHCSGYDGQGEDVCENHFDSLNCTWDHRSGGYCYPKNH